MISNQKLIFSIYVGRSIEFERMMIKEISVYLKYRLGSSSDQCCYPNWQEHLLCTDKKYIHVNVYTEFSFITYISAKLYFPFSFFFGNLWYLKTWKFKLINSFYIHFFNSKTQSIKLIFPAFTSILFWMLMEAKWLCLPAFNLLRTWFIAFSHF